VIGEPAGRRAVSSAAAGGTSAEAQQAPAVASAATKRKVFIEFPLYELSDFGNLVEVSRPAQQFA
jgi:hypothetical protein